MIAPLPAPFVPPRAPSPAPSAVPPTIDQRYRCPLGIPFKSSGLTSRSVLLGGVFVGLLVVLSDFSLFAGSLANRGATKRKIDKKTPTVFRCIMSLLLFPHCLDSSRGFCAACPVMRKGCVSLKGSTDSAGICHSLLPVISEPATPAPPPARTPTTAPFPAPATPPLRPPPPAPPAPITVVRFPLPLTGGGKGAVI